MLKKIGRFFEEHIEKIILIIVGLICVLLFIWRVLLSPNMVKIVNNEGETEKLSPSVIDKRVLDYAMLLTQTRTGPATDFNSYEPKITDFLAVLDSSIGEMDSRLAIPNPEIAAPKKVASGQYNVPDSIGRVTAVEAEHIRAAAYLPTEPVTELRSYDQVEHEPNDIDIVTVEGKFDIAGLFNQFHITFVDQVEEQYADPCLAIPVFASVNLQRRELTSDGTWSEWHNVPRTRIEQYKNLFENIKEGMDLPSGGLKVQILQFDNKQMQIDLLQPQAYQIASAREDWFPPSLHDDYETAVRKEISRERKEEREAQRQERQERTRDTADRRGTRSGGRGGYDGGIGTDTGRRGRAGGGRRGNTAIVGDTGFNDGRNTGRGRRGRGQNTDMEMESYMADGLTTAQASLTNEVYREFYKIRLNWTTDLSKIRDPLTFWAFDDTVEPEKTYQYKVRLGVFNPVAEEKDEVVIWSEFSAATEPVEIPGKLYFYVKNIQETSKTVTITVCKYILGYWRVEDFRGIGPGEAIGGIKEYEPEEPEEQPFIAGGDMRLGIPRITTTQQPVEEAEIINFDTKAVIVDVVAVNDWASSDGRNLSATPYYDMLYSYGGADIEHMPVSLSNLPERMRREIYRVNSLSTDKPEPFKAFGSSRTTQRGMGTDGRGGEYNDMMMFEDMMMDGRY